MAKGYHHQEVKRSTGGISVVSVPLRYRPLVDTMYRGGDSFAATERLKQLVGPEKKEPSFEVAISEAFFPYDVPTRSALPAQWSVLRLSNVSIYSTTA